MHSDCSQLDPAGLAMVVMMNVEPEPFTSRVKSEFRSSSPLQQQVLTEEDVQRTPFPPAVCSDMNKSLYEMVTSHTGAFVVRPDSRSHQLVVLTEEAFTFGLVFLFSFEFAIFFSVFEFL